LDEVRKESELLIEWRRWSSSSVIHRRSSWSSGQGDEEVELLVEQTARKGGGGRWRGVEYGEGWPRMPGDGRRWPGTDAILISPV
jgi:hypothetical protein